MEPTNTPFEEPSSDSPEKKKKKRSGFTVFLIVLLLTVCGCAVGGTAYYLHQRQLPAQTVERFLKSMQNMDFEGMGALLQSSDLSALDNADIHNAAYADFFKKINEKMTYKLTKNKFDIQNGTAQITVHIQYIDGADIYRETISEFLRHIVSTALAGGEITDAANSQTQETLAAILNEKADSTKDTFTEADITYPLIKEDDTWKIVALDNETVKIMSANFKNVQDEITRSLSGLSEDTVEPDSSEAPAAAPGDTIDLTVEKFSIHYTGHRVTSDFGGTPCLLVYYDYTNTSSSPSSAMVDLRLQAYQNGELCDAAIPEENDSALDHFMTEIKPGETANVCQAFSLKDKSDVTLQAGESFHFGNGKISSQILKIK